MAKYPAYINKEVYFLEIQTASIVVPNFANIYDIRKCF